MPTFSTPQPISVTVELGIGDLTIAAGDRTDTVVDVEPTDPSSPADVSAAARTTVEYAGGMLQVKAPRGWRRFSFRGGAESVVVRVQVPTGSRLRADAGLGVLRSTGTLGECRAKIGAGDVAIGQVSGDVVLTTGSGSIAIDRIGGSGSVRNSNGDTWIGEAGGALRVKAANGRIAVDHAGAAVTAKSANGDVRLDEVAGGTVVAETACGRVDVSVRSGVAAWLDLHTGFGTVRNLLDAGERPGPSERSVDVRARTACGDITVRRAEVGTGRGAA